MGSSLTFTCSKSTIEILNVVDFEQVVNVNWVICNTYGLTRDEWVQSATLIQQIINIPSQ